MPLKVAAYVMAGGGSRRFGDEDKARALVEGTTLIERNARILQRRYGDVTIVSAPGRSYGDLGLRTITDIHPGLGPLAGIHSALVDTDGDAIAVAACDLHGLRGRWYTPLEDAIGTARAAAFRDDARWHPLVALYRRELVAELATRLDGGRLAVRDVLEEFAAPVAPPEDFRELRSIDRPDDLT